MILEFEVENYRSIKDKQVFSMVAESSKSKPENVFEHRLASGDTVRLLKAAVIYGANASGKSNLLRAFFNFRLFIVAKLSINDPITFYDPFLFDKTSKNNPSRFCLTFIGEGNYKYRYAIAFNNEEVFQESLDYYPKGKAQNLFKRLPEKSKDGSIHTAKLGQIKNYKTLKVFKNQLILSKFGFNTPDEDFSPIYQYFNANNISILSPTTHNDLENLIDTNAIRLAENPELITNLNKLLHISDTKIEGVFVVKKAAQGKKNSTRNKEYDSFANHAVFDNQQKIDTISLSLDQESKGSKMLFALGVNILYKLKLGGVYIVDEIDTSLHPKLAKTLIQLFQNKTSNPKNTQIIFSTHETAFLDKDLFRKDQIWFTEKNEYGETELFSVQDFDKVREDTPFEKWYMAGKFGGIPDIQSLETIFTNGTPE